MQLIKKNEHAGVSMAENCMIEVTQVSMGPLEEWGPGKTAPVAPPLGSPDYLDGLINMKGKNFTNSQEHLVLTYNSRLF